MSDQTPEQANRWQVEGATPEAKALIEEMLTDDVMHGIETEAAGEAARRALYGGKLYQPPRVSPSRADQAVDEFVAKLPKLAPAVTEGPPPTALLLTVGDLTGAPARPVSAGRHLNREHWMKRLFLRGRS